MNTGMQRLVAAINGTPSDRVPVFCNLLDQGAREMGVSLREYYSRGDLVAEGQLRMRARYGYDNLWSLFYVGKEAELLGCQSIIFADNGPPNVGHMVIRTEDDIHRLRVPDDVASHPAFEQELECLRILRREAGGKYPICAYITSTMTLPALLMGMEKWMHLLLRGSPALRDELLDRCHEFFVREVQAYREAGADVLVYSNPFGSTDFVPMKFFLEHSLPWIEKDVRAVGSAGMVYYCGSARFNKVISLVRERTGLGVWYLSPLDDLSEARRIISDTGLCCGVINDIKMIDWTPDQVRDEVRRMFDAAGPGGHFLFGTLVMPWDIPEANIHAMLDAAWEFGHLEDCRTPAGS